MDIKEVARKGGLSTLKKYGTEHYRKMGLNKRGKTSIGSGRKRVRG
jgi:hypothetical protein